MAKETNGRRRAITPSSGQPRTQRQTRTNTRHIIRYMDLACADVTLLVHALGTHAALSERYTNAWALAAADALQLADDAHGLRALVTAIADCEVPR